MDQILLWIQNYGTPAIIVLIALEYACFPISSELVLPFAGAFGAGHGTPLFLLIIYSSIAGLIGTTFTYLIGRFGGSPLLDRLMRRFPSTEKPILSSYRTFGDHGKNSSLPRPRNPTLPHIHCLCRRFFQTVFSCLCHLFRNRNYTLE